MCSITTALHFRLLLLLVLREPPSDQLPALLVRLVKCSSRFATRSSNYFANAISGSCNICGSPFFSPIRRLTLYSCQYHPRRDCVKTRITAGPDRNLNHEDTKARRHKKTL